MIPAPRVHVFTFVEHIHPPPPPAAAAAGSRSSLHTDALNLCAIRGAPLISSSRENAALFA